jgi:hypothetical protein
MEASSGFDSRAGRFGEMMCGGIVDNRYSSNGACNHYRFASHGFRYGSNGPLILPSGDASVEADLACISDSLSSANCSFAEAPTLSNQIQQWAPLDRLVTSRDRMNFQCLVQPDQRFVHLLKNNIQNLGFVFEVGDKEFDSLDLSEQLTGLGSLSLKRWKNVKGLHFIFPSADQLYHARSAAGVHYQAQFKEFFQALSLHQGEISVIFYDPIGCHSTSYLKVLNGSRAKEYTSRIDWCGVVSCIDSDSSNNENNSQTSRQAPGNSSDYASLHHNVLGVSKALLVM